MKPFLSIILLLTSASFLSAEQPEINIKQLDNGKYIYTYEEDYYNGTGESFFSIEKTDLGYIAVWNGINDVTEVYADNDFKTTKIIITDCDTRLTVVRNGDLLQVYGITSGKEIKETLELGSENWFQLLPFSLIPFSTSDDEKIVFSIFDPYNIKVREIELEKKKTETALISGKKYSAVKMTMRLQGLLKPFWKSELWNCRESGLYLKYEGLNVIPKLHKSRIHIKNMEFISIDRLEKKNQG